MNHDGSLASASENSRETQTSDRSQTTAGPDVLLNKVIKLEKHLNLMGATLTKSNQRLGSEIISSSESEDLSDIEKPVANTRYYERDGLFASKYFFITNVRADANVDYSMAINFYEF